MVGSYSFTFALGSYYYMTILSTLGTDSTNSVVSNLYHEWHLTQLRALHGINAMDLHVFLKDDQIILYKNYLRLPRLGPSLMIDPTYTQNHIINQHLNQCYNIIFAVVYAIS